MSAIFFFCKIQNIDYYIYKKKLLDARSRYFVNVEIVDLVRNKNINIDWDLTKVCAIYGNAFWYGVLDGKASTNIAVVVAVTVKKVSLVQKATVRARG